MKSFSTMPAVLNKLIPWSWALLWFMLPLSMKGTTIVLWAFGLLVIAGTLFHRPAAGSKRIILTLLFFWFFLWHLVSMLITPGAPDLKSLEKFVPLAVVPLLLLLADQRKYRFDTWAARGFFGGLALSGLHMIVAAAADTLRGGGMERWFYHAFASPYHTGAIYYSWYLAAALLLLAFRQQERMIGRYRLLFIIFFLLLLMLSSSRMIILVTVPLVLWGTMRRWAALKDKKIWIGMIVIVVALGSVPFLQRVADLKNTDLDLVTRQEYAYDTPFNGITLRLVQWRLGWEILNEKQAWLTGTGQDKKQSLLDEQYRELGVYTGNSDLGDTGYLGYNFHNQYVETLVGTGIIGFASFLLLLGYILATGRKERIFPLAFFVLTALLFMTESVLERQAGIMLFCLAACTFRSKASDKELIYGSRIRKTSPDSRIAGHSFQPTGEDKA